MTGVCKDNDGETGESRHDAHPVDYTDLTALLYSVARCKVIDNKNDKIAYGDECDYAGVLQRIQFAQER